MNGAFPNNYEHPHVSDFHQWRRPDGPTPRFHQEIAEDAAGGFGTGVSLCANADPQRDSLFTKGPSNVPDHATSEIATSPKLGIDATKRIPGEGFKRP